MKMNGIEFEKNFDKNEIEKIQRNLEELKNKYEKLCLLNVDSENKIVSLERANKNLEQNLQIGKEKFSHLQKQSMEDLKKVSNMVIQEITKKEQIYKSRFNEFEELINHLKDHERENSLKMNQLKDEILLNEENHKALISKLDPNVLFKQIEIIKLKITSEYKKIYKNKLKEMYSKNKDIEKDFEDRNLSLTKQLNVTSNELFETKTKLSIEESERKSVENQLIEIKNQLSSFVLALENAKIDNTKLLKEFEALKTMKETNSLLLEKINNQEKELYEYQSHIKLLKSEIESMQKEKCNLINNNSILLYQKDEMNNNIQKQETVINMLKSKVAIFENQINSLNKHIDKSRNLEKERRRTTMNFVLQSSTELTSAKPNISFKQHDIINKQFLKTNKGEQLKEGLTESKNKTIPELDESSVLSITSSDYSSVDTNIIQNKTNFKELYNDKFLQGNNVIRESIDEIVAANSDSSINFNICRSEMKVKIKSNLKEMKVNSAGSRHIDVFKNNFKVRNEITLGKGLDNHNSSNTSFPINKRMKANINCNYMKLGVQFDSNIKLKDKKSNPFIEISKNIDIENKKVPEECFIDKNNDIKNETVINEDAKYENIIEYNHNEETNKINQFLPDQQLQFIQIPGEKDNKKVLKSIGIQVKMESVDHILKNDLPLNESRISKKYESGEEKIAESKFKEPQQFLLNSPFTENLKKSSTTYTEKIILTPIQRTKKVDFVDFHNVLIAEEECIKVEEPIPSKNEEFFFEMNHSEDFLREDQNCHSNILKNIKDNDPDNLNIIPLEDEKLPENLNYFNLDKQSSNSEQKLDINFLNLEQTNFDTPHTNTFKSNERDLLITPIYEKPQLTPLSQKFESGGLTWSDRILLKKNEEIEKLKESVFEQRIRYLDIKHDLNMKICELERQLVDLNFDSKDFENQKSITETQIKSLELDIMECKDRERQLNLKIDEFRDKIQEYDRREIQMGKEKDIKINELNFQIQELNKKLSNECSIKKDLETKLSSISIKNTDLDNLCKEAKFTVINQQSDIEGLKFNNSKLSDCLSNRNQDFLRLKNQFEQLKDLCTEQDNQLTTSELIIEKNEKEINELKSKMLENKPLVQEVITAPILSKPQIIEKHQPKLSHCEDPSNIKWKQKYSVLESQNKNEIIRLEENSKQLEFEHKSLKSALKTKDQQIYILKDELSHSDREFEQIENEMKKLHEYLKSKDNHIETLKEEINGLQNYSKDIQETLKTKESQINFLKEELRGWEDKNNVMDIELKNLRTSVETRDKEMNILKEEISKEITRLQGIKTLNINLNQELDRMHMSHADVIREKTRQDEYIQQMNSKFQLERIQFEETNAQQAKLINFLQCKIDTLPNKKKLFGSG